jgi:uncharacterized membrane protein YeaQ/YmgE (transglycosylase-associated protein family)
MLKIIHWRIFSGFTLLSITVLTLLGLTVYDAWLFHSIGGVLNIILFIGAVTAIISEAKQLKFTTANNPEWISQFWQVFSVFTAGIVTYGMSHDLGLGPVISASVIALIAHMIAPKYSVAAYCGSFVGMTSNLLLYNYQEVALASFIAGIVFFLTSDVFNGFGGKLGTIALLSTAITCHSLNRDFLTLSIADSQTNLWIILVAAIAAALTYYLNIYRKQGSVLASAVVGIIGAMILPPLFPEIGNTLAVVAICASFTGMTSKDRCGIFWNILITGVLTGILFVYSTPQLGGAGGKLGTIAFGSVLSACGYRKILTWFADRKLKKHNN